MPLFVDIPVWVTYHADGSVTVTHKETSCRVTGHVTSDCGRQTAVIDTGDVRLSCDTVVQDGSIYLFTEVRVHLIIWSCWLLITAFPQLCAVRRRKLLCSYAGLCPVILSECRMRISYDYPSVSIERVCLCVI